MAAVLVPAQAPAVAAVTAAATAQATAAVQAVAAAVAAATLLLQLCRVSCARLTLYILLQNAMQASPVQALYAFWSIPTVLLMRLPS